MRIGNSNSNNKRMASSTMAYMTALLALQVLTVWQQQLHPAVVVHGYQLRQPPRRPSFFFSRFKFRSSSTASQPTTTTITSITPSPISRRSKRHYRNGNDDSAMDETLDEGTTASAATTTSTTTIVTTKQGKRQRIKKVLASSNPLGRRRNKHVKATVRSVDELRQAVLDQGLSLSNVAIVAQQEQNMEQQHPTTPTTSTTFTSIPTDFFHNHAVRELMAQRYHQQSMPGHRSVHNNDTAILALSIEGGGMRGCVSAGMVAAVACLGLSDTIDRVYGSSAGSVVGAYLVSRQVCMDVYVDILPAAQKLFVCKTRMMQSLASSLVDVLVKSSTSSLSSWKNNNNTTAKATAAAADTHGESPLSSSELTTSSSSPPPPGMNISFVLDGILGQDHGIRPLDMDTFRQNDAKQPLRVVSSTIDPETGRLCSKCFGTRDFFDETMAVKKADGTRSGLFACLEASMTVPGATGPPVRLRQSETGKVLPCFDAFCFEPIPYRSAVEEGATHVLVLASRPEEYQPKTRPGVYETGVAPLYFHSHGHGEVAEFFEQGGQQYLYAEDLLALEEAKSRKVFSPDSDEDQKVMVPPAEILYGVQETPEMRYSMENRETEWKRAHLMPLRVPRGHKELPTLEQGKDAVLEAVRGGFATAFDSLSSIVGLEHISGAEAAKLVFPEDDESDMARILGSVMHVPGEEIPAPALQQMMDAIANDNIVADADDLNDPLDLDQVIHGSPQDPTSLIGGTTSKDDLCHHTLLAILPGFQGGRLSHLARGLKNGAATSNREK